MKLHLFYDNMKIIHIFNQTHKEFSATTVAFCQQTLLTLGEV